MTVKKIDLGHFSIQVRNPRLAAELQKLDTDANGTINLEDIRLPNGVEDEGIQSTLLKKAVSAAFVNAGSISKDEQKTLEDTIDLYAEVQDFRRAVSKWHQWGKVETTNGKKSLAFDHATYCSNRATLFQLPWTYLADTGWLSVFAARLHHVLHGFGKGVCPREKADAIRSSRQSCDVGGFRYLTGMTYDPLKIPEELRDPVKDVVQNYLTGANWLVQFDTTYCGSVRGSGNSISTNRLIDFDRLERLDKGTANVHYYDKKLPQCDDGF